MFLTPEEAAARLTSNKNALNKEEDKSKVLPLHPGARRFGDTDIPMDIRALIGTAAHMGTVKDVAEAFGVSVSSTQAYKSGKTGSTMPKNEELEEKIDNNLGRVRDTALDHLMGMMGLIDYGKAKNGKVKDVVSMAKDLSTIVRNTTKQEVSQGNAQVIIYAPAIRDEKTYGEPIEVEAVER